MSRSRLDAGRRRPRAWRAVVAVAVFSVLLGSCSAGEEKPAVSDLWAGLEPGPFTVGFKVMHLSDAGRPFGDDGRPRIVQVLVWYPAVGGGAALTYEEYFRLAATQSDVGRPTPAQRQEHLVEVRRTALEEGADPARFDALLRLETHARPDARPAPGRHPVVAFAPGLGAPAFQNTVFCEYLASHGFVVAASPSVGPASPAMPRTVAGLEAQIADIRLGLDAVGRLEVADPARTGLIGYSWGGLAVLLAAMRPEPVKAVAALDPTVIVKAGHQLARDAPGYHPGRLRAPTLLLVSAGKPSKERDLSFFDEITGAEAWMFGLGAFTHGDFASTIVHFFLATKPNHGGRDLARVTLGYTTTCRYLLAFLNAHLRSDRAARALLEAAPAEAGIPDGVFTIRRHRPAATPGQR